MRSPRRHRAREPRPERDHGPHTLRVVRGTVVGRHGDDVFVELGPRMQGVLSARAFDEEPAVGDEHDFTLRGQEDSLWVLTLAPRASESLRTWEDMEPGSLVQARVTGRNDGGLELKVGPLHAFMPRSHTGLPHGSDLRQLHGRTIACEVMEVDAEKERVLLSRKLVLQRERESERQRQVGALAAGQVVQGRVSRIERYGAFVRFGRGLEGLVHVSDLAHDRVEHPSERLEVGQAVEARVLSIKRGGRRIALGLKQLEESPWARLEQVFHEDQVVEGRVTRVVDYGAFVEVRRGVEGLLHRSETGLPADQPVRSALRPGQPLAVRIVRLDVEAERLSLSLLHRSGARVEPDDATPRELLDDLAARSEDTPLGRLLRRALRGPSPDGPGERRNGG